jgi:RNA polymerase sigma factor for flagellar operon FliA
MKAYQRQPNPERDRLIAENLEVAERIAARIARRCPSFIGRDDLHAAALLGLTEAAARYDSSREEPFIGFAEKRIRGAILDELRRGDMMPRRTRKLAREIGAVLVQLERELSRPPTDEEVAARLGVSLDEYKSELEQLVHVTVGSLDEMENDSLRSMESSPEQEAGRKAAMRRVRAALPQMEARDLLVLSLYYNEELTYPEIAEVLRLTKSRVCQLHGRAIARLRAAMELETKEAA